MHRTTPMCVGLDDAIFTVVSTYGRAAKQAISSTQPASAQTEGVGSAVYGVMLRSLCVRTKKYFSTAIPSRRL